MAFLPELPCYSTVHNTRQKLKIENCENDIDKTVKLYECELKHGVRVTRVAMTRKYSSLGPSVSLRATPRWSFLSSAATNVSKFLVVSVAIAAAIITAVSVHNLYPVEDPITPIGYLDREVAPDIA